MFLDLKPDASLRRGWGDRVDDGTWDENCRPSSPVAASLNSSAIPPLKSGGDGKSTVISFGI